MVYGALPGRSRAECDGSGDEWRVGSAMISSGRDRRIDVKMEVCNRVKSRSMGRDGDIRDTNNLRTVMFLVCLSRL